MLSNYSTYVPGDYNQDGTVDAADYTVYRNRRAGIGGTTLPNEGAGVTPGQVTIEDYNFWKAHYGETFPGSGSGSGDSILSTVPEPGTLPLVILAAACVRLRQRRAFGLRSGGVSPPSYRQPA